MALNCCAMRHSRSALVAVSNCCAVADFPLRVITRRRARQPVESTLRHTISANAELCLLPTTSHCRERRGGTSNLWPASQYVKVKESDNGPVAQLGARFHGMEEVVSSNLTRSTKTFKDLQVPPDRPESARWSPIGRKTKLR